MGHRYDGIEVRGFGVSQSEDTVSETDKLCSFGGWVHCFVVVSDVFEVVCG